MSLISKLRPLNIGESIWIECAYSDHKKIMTNLGARMAGRMPKDMALHRFKTELFTCIPATNPSGITYAVKITRLHNLED
jgi:hypothetical protein